MVKFFYCLLALLAPWAQATEMVRYPSPVSNHDICPAMETEGDRKIPFNDWFCGGVDGMGFWRALGTEEFYHGFSYWIQGRTQFTPNPYLQINIRSLLYSGSVSYGYGRPTGFYNLVGFSGLWPETILGGEIRGRAMDLERLTVGAGNFVEDFESSGLRLDWSTDRWRVRLQAEGTGVFVLQDDTINLDISYGPEWVGLGGIWWTEAMDSRRKPLAYLYSIVPWTDYFSTKAEIDYKDKRMAYLLALVGNWKNDRWAVEGALQGRFYEEGVGEGFVGEINQIYVSFDQLDKAYTNAKNVFVNDDDVVVVAAKLDFTYALSERWQLFSLNEVGEFQYRQLDADKYYFHRYGFNFFPTSDRKDSLTFYGSNKVLRDSFQVPPYGLSKGNAPLFKSFDHWGIDANFRL